MMNTKDDEYSREAIEHLLNTKGCEIISTAGGRGVGEEAGSWYPFGKRA
jgi:hypothetical protein